MATSASAGSLLGFVSQLQNMEAAMSRILMETAMKLASMTDVGVFVLVEHSAGTRFFSGKRHLCDSYLDGRLAPIGNDVEMEVNPDVSALRERVADDAAFTHHPHPQQQQQQQQQQPQQRGKQKPTVPSSSYGRHRTNWTSSSSRKRTLSSSSSPPSKKTRPSDVANPMKREMTFEAFTLDESGGCADVDGAIGGANGVAFDSSVAVLPSSSPTFDAAGNDEADVICEENGDEEEEEEADEGEEEEEAEDIGVQSTSMRRSRRHLRHRNLDNGDCDNGNYDNYGNGRFGDADDNRDCGNSSSSALAVILSGTDTDKDWLFSEILHHPKLEAVQRIRDGDSVADKNSVDSKILNSLLYDFAKAAAAKCPFRNAEDAKCKQFYSVCFEEIWNEFLPNLRQLDEREVAARKLMPGNASAAAGRERSIRTCCRDLFRRNFFTLVRRQNKRESGESQAGTKRTPEKRGRVDGEQFVVNYF